MNLLIWALIYIYVHLQFPMNLIEAFDHLRHTELEFDKVSFSMTVSNRHCYNVILSSKKFHLF